MNIKTVKKFIWINLIVLFFSCSSRKTNTNIQSEENRSKIEQNRSSETNVHIKRTEVENEHKEVSKLSLSIKNNQNSLPNYNTGPQQDSENCPKPRNVTYRDKDGNEAIIPINENSEINLNSETTAETKLKQTEQYLSEQTKINELLKKENEELKKSKTKSSERSGISFSSLLWIIPCSAIAGIIIWSLIKNFIPAWFNTIVKQLNKKR
ncbi:hypothetical protein [Chryseobacterium daeguense]|uniref:hypothetical protein n=1 Tax=Chryseobacterium daeguense TaxID=412438 RepID=UPI00048A3AA2|nr:hypothetical protein [Chryseobacterium daeguense]